MSNNKNSHAIIIVIVLLCISVVANVIQCSFLLTTIASANEDKAKLEKYRDLQKRQIQFVKNGCENNKSDTGLLNRYNLISQIAANFPSGFLDTSREDFLSDIHFNYVEAYCYRPYILLLGVDDIYKQNLYYRNKWGGDAFHFDDSDFNVVRW